MDQLVRSRLFHRKLHEWGLLEIAREIEAIKGETLDWERQRLNIDDNAWKKAIHRGIKPVILFAHPYVLISNPKRVSYYRRLAMVSQKSMSRVSLPIKSCEEGISHLSSQKALKIAHHLNKIICELVKADEVIDVREFDLWRGMAAGTQAQGSWHNEKGKEAASLINDIVINHIRTNNLGRAIGDQRFRLKDGRELVISSEPDIAIYDVPGKIQAAVEIKGGIDVAGVLERLGAALKSLSRAKRENPESITIFALPSVAMTEAFVREVEASSDVDYYFAHGDLVNDSSVQTKFFKLLGL